MTRGAAATSTPTQIDGEPRRTRTPTDQAGSPLFAELVWAHHRYERERDRGRAPEDELRALQQAYLDKLDEFQDCAGRLEHVYWSTKQASAVAMTAKREPERPRKWRRFGRSLLEEDQEIELHRLTDWATPDTRRVADLMDECDLLAVRVGEVLRGTPERIAMRSLLRVEAHLLGFVERTRQKPATEPEEKAFVKAQQEELARVEDYYHRAASRAGRLVYITGMLMGLVPVLLIGTVLGLVFFALGLWDRSLELLLLSAGMGAVGAFVSAISRMGKPERGKLNIDFELGRPVIRQLGIYRPFLGAIAGVALYFLLASGIAQLQVEPDEEVAYYGLAAFLAGFSERFATVMFGSAERRFSKE
jgi:hypothetical protein